jgi:hypothetical protein
MNIYETLSLLSSILCFIANWLLHAKNLSKQKYAMLTFCTSIMFLISAIGFMNRGAIISEILWLLLSVYGIVKPMLKKKHTL